MKSTETPGRSTSSGLLSFDEDDSDEGDDDDVFDSRQCI
jgi:hypothetical protein